MSGMIESVALVLELLIMLLALENLFDKKVEPNRYTFLLIIVYLFVFEGINIGDFPTYTALLAYLAIIIYSLFQYKKSTRITLINFFLSYVIGGLLQLIFCIPLYYIYNRENGIAGLNSLLVNAASVLAIVFIRSKVKLKGISDFIQQKGWIVKISFILIILYLFINVFTMQVNKTIEGEDYIQITLFIIFFFLAIREWQKAIADAERKKTQLEMNKLYYDAYDELILLIRERQHDMKNHINAILGMIYTIDNYKDLVESQKKYCDDVVEKSKETKLLLSIGNPLIAGFLYRKFQEAQKSEIGIECKVVSNESDLFIPEYELIEVLGILIDNAIEALCKNMCNDKNIHVKIDDRDKFQVIVANTSEYYTPDEICKFFQKDYSSKGKDRGIGLSKLKRITQEKDQCHLVKRTFDKHSVS